MATAKVSPHPSRHNGLPHHSGVRCSWAPDGVLRAAMDMREFDELVSIMARLRDADGCPWDREQTHETLKPYMLEEVYEVLEAVDEGDAGRLCGELGDLLLQVVFHAQLGSEAGEFDMAAVCAAINEKLIRRHPHVFGDVQVRDSAHVVDNWEHLKRQEREAAPRLSVLDGVPVILPALKRATDVQKKAARVGFDWEEVSGPVAKLGEELAELDEARAGGDRGDVVAEIGDVLFAVVNIARFLHVDAEDALRMACDRFERRFRSIEDRAGAEGRSLGEMSLEEMDELWEAAKRAEHGAA